MKTCCAWCRMQPQMIWVHCVIIWEKNWTEEDRQLLTKIIDIEESKET